MKTIFSFIAGVFFISAMLFLSSCSDANSKKTKIGVCIPAATHGWAGGVVWNVEKSKKELQVARPQDNLHLCCSQGRS